MSKQVFDLPTAEAMVEAMDNAAMIKEISEKISEVGEQAKALKLEGGMVLADVLLNSEYVIKDEVAFAGKTAVDVVTLDSITALDGTEVEFGVVGGKQFVPSFDSKEDGKWIIHYFVKDIDENVILKLKASYDHNTKLVKAEGHGFERCSIRIDLKAAE